MLKKQLIYSIVLFIFSNAPLMGQVDIEWERNLGGSSEDYASSIQQTSNGENIVAGYSYSRNVMISNHNGLPDGPIVNLPSRPPGTLTVDAEICDGSSYLFGSQVLTKTGTYTEIFTSSLGSDSIVTVNLTVLPHMTNIIDLKICDGDSYT